MASILFKWLFAAAFLVTGNDLMHPVFVSVTEIEYNNSNKTIEVSCKIFTDDFEKTLRKHTGKRIDLLDEKQKKSMEPFVNDYLQKHLKLKADGKPLILKFLGYERDEEGIRSYFQADGISAFKELSVTDNILYEYEQQQISLLHVTVNGNRQSTKLYNPEDKALFSF